MSGQSGTRTTGPDPAVLARIEDEQVADLIRDTHDIAPVSLTDSGAFRVNFGHRETGKGGFTFPDEDALWTALFYFRMGYYAAPEAASVPEGRARI